MTNAKAAEVNLTEDENCPSQYRVWTGCEKARTSAASRGVLQLRTLTSQTRQATNLKSNSRCRSPTVARCQPSR